MKQNSKVIALTLMLWAGVAHAEIVAENLPVLTPESVGLETPFSDSVWGNPPDPQNLTLSLKAVQEVSFSVPEREVLRQVLLTATGSVDLLAPRLDTLMAQGFYLPAFSVLIRFGFSNVYQSSSTTCLPGSLFSTMKNALLYILEIWSIILAN